MAVNPFSRLVSALSILAVCFASPLRADVEYEVTIIPQVPGAFSSVLRGMNNDAEVVGWTIFPWPGPSLAAWYWSAETGSILLPPAPGSMANRYAAVTINDNGVILGDGGYDSGMAWRYEDGVYMVTGTLSGLGGSRAYGMNNYGDIVGESFNPSSFLTPPRGMLYTDEEGLVELFPGVPNTSGNDINDLGQIAATLSGPVIINPDGTQIAVPVPAGYVGASIGKINEAGDVAGIARCSHECNKPFFYSADGEMHLISPPGVRFSITGLNNSQQVVGNVEEGIARGWVWTQETGARLLQTLIDPELQLQIYYAYAINDRGQIVARGVDLSTSIDNNRMMLLTPISTTVMGDMDVDGDVDLVDFANFQLCFAGPGGAISEGACQFSDFDSDGDCDLVDFNAFQLAFTGAL